MTTVPGTTGSDQGVAGSGVPEQRDGSEEVETPAGPLDRDAVGVVVRADVAVVATADRYGERHVSVRAGEQCFVRVLDAHRLAWLETGGTDGSSDTNEGEEPRSPERANLEESSEVAVLLVGPGGRDRRALHLNGTARVVPSAELRAEHPDLPGRDDAAWVVVEVGDVYLLDGADVPPIAPFWTTPPAATAPMPARDRRSLVLAALAVVLVVACVALALLLGRGSTTPTAAPAPAAPPPAPSAPAGPATLFGRVVDVTDPATVVVDVAGAPMRVGVIGLDDATIPDCARPASLDFARRTLLGQTVTLVPDPTLPPPATPRAYLVLETQLSYTDAAIRGGHAPAAGASRYRAVFDDEQRQARSDGVGMWGAPCR